MVQFKPRCSHQNNILKKEKENKTWTLAPTMACILKKLRIAATKWYSLLSNMYSTKNNKQRKDNKNKNKKKGGWGSNVVSILKTKVLFFSCGFNNSLEPWLLRLELELSIDIHVITKNKLRISFINLLVILFSHQLWCRTYGSLQ